VVPLRFWVGAFWGIVLSLPVWAILYLTLS